MTAALSPGHILALFAALAVLVPTVTQRGMVVALALAAVSAAALHGRLRRGWWPAWRGNTVLLAIVVYVAWAALSAAWALDPLLALKQAGQLAGGLLGLALLLAVDTGLPEAERRLVGMGAVVGVMAGAAVLALDGYGGMPVQHLIHSGSLPPHMLNKGLLTLVLLAWPAALHLWQLGRRACAALLLCIVSIVVLPQDSSTAALALGCGITAALLARLSGRAALWLLGLGLVAAVAAMPLVVEPFRQWFTAHIELNSALSSHHRLYIWSFVLERLGERPWLGWGLEASRVMPDFGWKSWPGYDRVIPLHPHNNFLQAWLELGSIGVTLLLAALLLPLRRALALSWGQRMFAAGGWTAAVAAAVPGYGAGQSWWLFTVLAQAALFRAVLSAEEDD